MASQALNPAELEAVRKLLSAALVEAKKLKTYAEAAQDSDLQAWLRGQEKTARQKVQQLYTLLGGRDG